jgi:hypothetical protein
MLDSYIGDLFLEAVHIGSLQPFIADRKKEGRKNRTINFGLQIVRHILNLGASEWMDENSPTLTLLKHPEHQASRLINAECFVGGRRVCKNRS